jgi:hypothetical protein
MRYSISLDAVFCARFSCRFASEIKCFQSVTSLDEKAFSHETGGLNKQHCAQNTASSLDVDDTWYIISHRFKKGKVNKVLKALVEAQGHKLS